MNPELIVYMQQLYKKAPSHLTVDSACQWVANRLNTDEEYNRRYWTKRQVSVVLEESQTISYQKEFHHVYAIR